MARTTGPLMSLSASGSVAKTLTYSHWKGRPYVRQLVTPSNPKTQPQTYTRAMMAFLARAWALLPTNTPTAQATWDDLGKQGNFSPFNAFVKTNMLKWTQGQGPVETSNHSVADAPDTLGVVTSTGGVRQIAVHIPTTITANGFGYAIAVDATNSATPAITETRAITPGAFLDGASTHDALISNLAPGTYSTAIFQLDADGTIEARSNVIQGITVT